MRAVPHLAPRGVGDRRLSVGAVRVARGAAARPAVPSATQARPKVQRLVRYGWQRFGGPGRLQRVGQKKVQKMLREGPGAVKCAVDCGHVPLTHGDQPAEESSR